jgi:hypothetical protein
MIAAPVNISDMKAAVREVLQEQKKEGITPTPVALGAQLLR